MKTKRKTITPAPHIIIASYKGKTLTTRSRIIIII